MKERRVYEALAQGEGIQLILPTLARDLGANALVLYYTGEEEALVTFSASSLTCLEEMKNLLVETILKKIHSTRPSHTIHLRLSENQLLELDPQAPENQIKIYPILFQSELLGGVALAFNKSQNLSEDPQEIEEILAALGITQRIEKTRQIQEESLDRLDRMTQAGQIFSAGLSLDRTLVLLLEIAVDSVGTGAGVVVIKSDPEQNILKPIGWGLPADWVLEVCLLNGEKLVENILADGKPRYLTSLESLKFTSCPAYLTSIAIVPLTYEGGTLGCLCIPNPAHRFFESKIEQRALLALASLAAGAIRSAQLVAAEIRAGQLREEVKLAAYVQKTLMPSQLPKTDLLEAAALMHPARQLGGDFYDIFNLGDGRWGMMIADVAGKGAAAAILMATARAYLHVFAQQNLSPSQVLSKMNEALLPDLVDGKFLTAIYLLIDFPKGKIQMAGAGHHPVFFLEPDKKIRCVPCDDLPLGILQNDDFSEATLDLRRDTTILLYTDGLIEVKNSRGQFFGSEKLAKLLQSFHSHAAEELVQSLFNEVEKWTGNEPLPDDLTMLAVRIK